MSARIIFALACSDVAGTPDSGSSCSGAAPTVLFEGLDAYEALTVQDGFVYVEIPGTGVARCATTGCTEPTSVIGSPAFVSAALGSAGVTYTTQIASPDGTVGGEIRSANIDGSADQSLLGGLTYPAYVVKSGNRTFWVDDSFAIDDTPATVNCIGCNGSSSTPWMTGLGGGPYGMIADATNVYVLADDASLTSVTLLACRIDTPCWSEPRVVARCHDDRATDRERRNPFVRRAPATRRHRARRRSGQRHDGPLGIERHRDRGRLPRRASSISEARTGRSRASNPAAPPSRRRSRARARRSLRWPSTIRTCTC